MISITSAAQVNYSVKYRIQEPSGVNNTDNNINSVSVLAYKCLNVGCAFVNQTPFFSGSSGLNSNLVSIDFPIENYTNGYAIYFYKEGYIGWEERNVYVWGSGSFSNPTPVYLSNKRIKSANITNFVATNNSSCVNLSARIDSPITDIRVTDIPLKENASVLATFEVYNGSTLIYSENSPLFIQYSGSKLVDFDYCVQSSGNYTFYLHSDITDSKIINKIRDTESFNLNMSFPVVCVENSISDYHLVNNYCNGSQVWNNFSFNICQSNNWNLRFNQTFNSSCAYGCFNGTCNNNSDGGLFIEIISPIAREYDYSNILVNISSNGTTVWYNYNGTNVTYNRSFFLNLPEGNYNLFAWANNSSGSVVFDSVSFSVKLDDDCDSECVGCNYIDDYNETEGSISMNDPVGIILLDVGNYSEGVVLDEKNLLWPLFLILILIVGVLILAVLIVKLLEK
jgi:hypothetical protein